MQYLSPFPGFRKSRILARREEELRHALKRNLALSKIERAAERVRIAKLQLLKAFRQALPLYWTEDAALRQREEHLRNDAEAWEQRTTEAIIREYAPKAS